MNAPAFFGKPQRPSFDLTDALEYLQSPCASSGSSSAHSRLSRGSRNSFLMDDYIQEHLQAALKNTGNLLESRKVRHEDTVDKEGSALDTVDKRGSALDTVDKEGSALDKAGSTVDKAVSTVDKGESDVDKDDHEDGSNESSFLHGVVFSVSRKCTKQLSDINNMATSVGAQCRDNLDKSCTHLIHEVSRYLTVNQQFNALPLFILQICLLSYDLLTYMQLELRNVIKKLTRTQITE